MEWTSGRARERYADYAAVAAESIAAFDLDGTLSPIVADPTAARIHDDAPGVLTDLAATVRAIAIVTGRPAQQALALGDLDQLADRMRGTDLVVLGQYGNERWSSRERHVVSPDPPPGLADFERDLPALLGRADVADAHVEHKGLAVAVHTRRLPDSDAAFARLVEPVGRAADAHGLVVEPGRHVLEVRAAGTDKGAAVRALVEAYRPRGVLFAGDDLGDVPAFEAVAELREDGLAGLLVCSGSQEESSLRDLADVVVDGPAGVLALVRDLVAAVSAR